MSSRMRKTEHAGAKNRGGFWGPKAEAKQVSKKLRRNNSKRLLRKELKKST